MNTSYNKTDAFKEDRAVNVIKFNMLSKSTAA